MSISSSETKTFRPLEPGKSVRIVQPAYRMDAEIAARLQPMLADLGVMLDDVPERNGFGKLSDHDSGRSKELMEAFADPNVDAVIVGQGGYGCARLLESLDWDFIAMNPKPFIGFSDATALLIPLSARIGCNAVHGPTARSLVRDADQTTLAAFAAVLFGDWAAYNDVLLAQVGKTRLLRPGNAKGRMIGGNLSLLAALCGTPFEIDPNGAILFLEEWNEPQYRFDRMLMQLKLAGILDRVSGIVLGHFLNIERVGEDLAEEIEQRLLDLVPSGIPILSHFPVGHGPTNLPILQGAIYSVNDTRVAYVASDKGAS